MTRWYVRASGSDSTGSGTVLRPFRTIRKATTLWSSGDSIDVGEGDFVETTPFAFVARGSILGAGFGSTIVRVSVDGLIGPTFGVLTVGNMTIDQALADASIVAMGDATGTFGRLVLSHVEFALQSGYLVTGNPLSPQTRVDILNCLIRSRSTDRAGRVVSVPRQAAGAAVVTMRNTLLTRLSLVVDDQDGGGAIDSDYNLYFDNDRELRVGRYGTNDVRGVDPRLSASLVPSRDSPVRNAGRSLLDGYGEADRPTEDDPAVLTVGELPEVAVPDFGYAGSAPDIGLTELLEPSGAASVTAVTARTLLDALGAEIDAARSALGSAIRDRSIELAGPTALQRRFADPLGLVNASGMTSAEYRAFVTEMLDVARTSAPALRAVERAVEAVVNVHPVVYQHDRVGRFRLGPTLKLHAFHSVPGDDTLTLRVVAGEVLLDDAWYRVKETLLPVPAGATSNVFSVAGYTETDGTLSLFVSDLPEVEGGLVENFSVSAVIRRGERAVTGTGFSALARHRIVSFDVQPIGRRYVVDEVLNDSSLLLRTPVAEPDQDVDMLAYASCQSFGTVTADADTITSIRCAGRVGQSTFADSRASRANAFDVVLNADGDIDDDGVPAVNQLLNLLRRLSPVQKLVALSFASQYPVGKFVTSVRRPSRLSVDYVEGFDDMTWPS